MWFINDLPNSCIHDSFLNKHRLLVLTDLTLPNGSLSIKNFTLVYSKHFSVSHPEILSNWQLPMCNSLFHSLIITNTLKINHEYVFVPIMWLNNLSRNY
ncbi:hypothetical protein NQ317_013032 [Molorchus minor]|uniref:Uncharacterized protein n=1 Tax=Molorchus minor TaxID=1323400 RepID=A0ABQ9K5L1_9CUCU|nr:hypothetical protein NQ317_013032 [Molorchus minor]